MTHTHLFILFHPTTLPPPTHPPPPPPPHTHAHTPAQAPQNPPQPPVACTRRCSSLHWPLNSECTSRKVWAICWRQMFQLFSPRLPSDRGGWKQLWFGLEPYEVTGRFHRKRLAWWLEASCVGKPPVGCGHSEVTEVPCKGAGRKALVWLTDWSGGI